MAKDERYGDGRRFLNAPILVLKGLFQKMTETDIPEEKKATSEMLAIISPSAMLSKGRVERWIGKSDGKHVRGAVLLKEVPYDDRDRPARMTICPHSGRITLAGRRPSRVSKHVIQ